MHLDNLAEIEDPAIKSKAIEVLRNGDPVDYMIWVYNRLHVGDTQIGKILLLSIGCQSVINSEGLQPKLSGPSGKGKTHAAKSIYHLIPDLGYKLAGSLSAKSLFYFPDMKPGTIVFRMPESGPRKGMAKTLPSVTASSPLPSMVRASSVREGRGTDRTWNAR